MSDAFLRPKERENLLKEREPFRLRSQKRERATVDAPKRRWREGA